MIKSINALKFLSMDMINKANSGHPGIALGAAPTVYELFKNHLVFNIKHPNWWNRDQFVLSAGHGSSLLYSTLHLAGYDFSIEDLKQFRQFNEKVAGHPEYDLNLGIEVTTGPLGQGIASAVGKAIAQKYLESKFNKEDAEIFTSKIYALCGDGDLQEGVAYESISIAGKYKLNNLILLYDSNDIQLDGQTSKTTLRDNKKFFESLGWKYSKVSDGENLSDLHKAINGAKSSLLPTVIEIKTIIGIGSSNQGTAKVHGAPLGVEETNKMKIAASWDCKEFEVPNEVYEDFKDIQIKNNLIYEKWEKVFSNYKHKYKAEYELLNNTFNNNLIVDEKWFDSLKNKEVDATRNISGNILNIIQEKIPTLIGGSADLVSSTKVKGIDGDFDFNSYSSRNINFGVREFAMSSIGNGIASTGLLVPFTSTFFVFTDYLKPAIRLSSLMKLQTLGIFTHDSVAVGEDGPTHEPIEQLWMLRSIPNHVVFRPADLNEVIGSYKYAIENRISSSIVLTRQNVTNLRNTSIHDVSKGFYIVEKEDVNKTLDYIIIATGSELELAIKIKNRLPERNIRVISAVSTNLFDKQSEQYKNELLNSSAKKVIIEAGSNTGWFKYTNQSDLIISIDSFGQSGDGIKLLKKLGFDASQIIEKMEAM